MALIGICSQFIAFWLKSGAIGLAISYSLAYILMAVFVFILTALHRSQRDLLFEWTRDSFSELWETSWLCMKTIAYQFSMRLFVEIGTVAIALLDQNHLAAQSILLRYGIAVMLIGMGFWAASVALLGRAAGSGKRAKFLATFWATIIFFLAIAVLVLVLLVALEYPLAYLTTSLSAVQRILVDMSPIVGVYVAFLLLWIGSQTLVFSLGRVNVPTVTTLFADFVIGIPLALILTFQTPLRLFGFYIGIVVSYLLKCGIIWLYYACSWNDILSIISESSRVIPASESSPFLAKSHAVQSAGTQYSPTPENHTGNANFYGTVDSSQSAEIIMVKSKPLNDNPDSR